ncbi:MAG: C4-type zinc ribbon domain-containing protein [Acidimicrobiia bacterium]
MTNPLEELLALQERDLALDRLQLRRDTLPARAALSRTHAQHAALGARRADTQVKRDEVAREEQRLDDEARSLEAKAKEVDAKMYSGEISSPRELQAMQADVESLQRHQRDVENRELEAMEQREPLDAELADFDTQLAALRDEGLGLQANLAESEAEIDAEMVVERGARDTIAAGIDPALVAAYAARRAQAGGTGASGVARLVGGTCQGCHLSIPSTEVERIKKAPEGTLAYCDNCGCILVP